MKKLIISVNGKKYDVEVEVLDEDDSPVQTQAFYNPSLFKSENYGLQNPSSDNVIIARPSSAPASGKNTQNSPVNGKLMEIYIHEGDTVAERDKILAIEAMKMKTNIYASRNGKIAKIHVRVGDQIDQNQLLITYE
jgi:biotin carboxyl carrier protein